jgi:hypothetical protein
MEKYDIIDRLKDLIIQNMAPINQILVDTDALKKYPPDVFPTILIVQEPGGVPVKDEIGDMDGGGDIISKDITFVFEYWDVGNGIQSEHEIIFEKNYKALNDLLTIKSRNNWFDPSLTFKLDGYPKKTYEDYMTTLDNLLVIIIKMQFSVFEEIQSNDNLLD